MNSFHVVTRAMGIVVKLRLKFAAERHAQAKAWKLKGCCEVLEQIGQEGQKVKAAKFAAGKRPEPLTEKHNERRMWLETLYIVSYKDCLSKLVRRYEADKIQENLNIWSHLVRKSRIPEIRALGEKIG